jgi:hypothetical protein
MTRYSIRHGLTGVIIAKRLTAQEATLAMAALAQEGYGTCYRAWIES